MQELYEMKVGTFRSVYFALVEETTNGPTHEERGVIRVPGGWYISDFRGLGVFVPITFWARVKIMASTISTAYKKAKT